MEDCPLPEVAEALRPYIRPRDEVSRIRSELQAHMQRQVNGAKSALSSVSVVDSHNVGDRETSSTVTGVRKAYLKALQAHSAAQERYDALKAELAQQSNASKDATRSTGSSIKDSYISLLRQREKQRKLQIIDRTFSELNSVGKAAVNGHLDDIVKQQAGDLPTPPTAQPPAFGDKPDVESRILQLKKAILSTKRSVDGQKHFLPNGAARSGTGGEVAGLQSALNELTGWMEQQLAIIGDAEADAQAPPPTPGRNGSAAPEVASLQDIEALYNDYLAARERLVQTVSSPPTLTAEHVATSPSPLRSRSNDAAQRSTTAEALLPYIDSLTQAKEGEQSIVQQSTHIRRQVASSEEETRRLISRLADESHLVHPGANKGSDWAEAAIVSGKNTHDFVLARLGSGETSASAAKKVLSDIEQVPRMLDVLTTTPPT